MCKNGLVFFLCGRLRNCKSIKTAAVGEKLGLVNRRIQHCVGFVGILYSIYYSSRRILLYSDHLEGRQTVENHLVHMGTSSYRHTHRVTSSIYLLVHFFAVFIFTEAGLSTKIAKICTQRKFPAVRYLLTLGLEFYTGTTWEDLGLVPALDKSLLSY